MTESELVEKQATPFAVRLMLILLVFVAVSSAYYVPFLAPLRVPVGYGLLLLSFYVLYLVVSMYRVKAGSLPVAPFVVGVVLIADGTAFDVIVTVLELPTLSW